MKRQIYSHEDTAELRTTLGAKMRARRKELKLTQAKAADRIGKSTEFYARMERGHALPSVGTLKDVADGLGLSVDYLLGLDEERPPMDLASYADSRSIEQIVARARGDKQLTWVLGRLLEVCERSKRTSG